MKGKMPPGLAKAAKAKKEAAGTAPMGSSGASGKMPPGLAKAKAAKGSKGAKAMPPMAKEANTKKLSKMPPGMMPKTGAMKKAKAKK